MEPNILNIESSNKHLYYGFAGGIVIGITFFILKLKYGVFTFSLKSNKQRQQAYKILSKIGNAKILDSLNDHELQLASQLVDPANIDITFDDIAGLDDTVEAIKSNIILPLLINQHVSSDSQHFKTPKGVLLYGPPGCGKTMLAKATAKVSNARFINLEIPTLTQKMYGESQKLATAVFTLAQKLQPCIIFIDEIDTFLRARGHNEHEATAMVKAQFMILWDGLYSKKSDTGIIVMGATNRPQDVDPAIIRRMPMMYEIPLPNTKQRGAILNKLLINEPVDSNVSQRVIDRLANSTERFSASDISELCRYAIFSRVREQSDEFIKLISESKPKDHGKIEMLINDLRNVTEKDFDLALDFMKSSKSFLTKINKFVCEHVH